MGEGLGVVLGVLKIFGVPECPRKIDLEAQWGWDIMPTTLVRAPPDFQTLRQPCIYIY